eukprot:5207975-Prymnesium_polylepis.1
MDPEDFTPPESIAASQVGSPCYSPPPPDDGGDPYGGCSADMFYDKPGDSGDECTPQLHDGPRVHVRRCPVRALRVQRRGEAPSAQGRL